MQQAKLEVEAKAREEWKARMRAREAKERYEKAFKANERKLQLEEWKQSLVLEPGHGPTRW